MMKILYLFLFVFVFLGTVFCRSGMACQRPDGEEGNCIVLQNCEYYINIYNELKREIARDILRKAHCGYEGTKPKVCCPIMECSSSTAAEAEDYVPAFLDPPVCGITTFPIDLLVSGGVRGRLHDFPWMALLGYHTRIGHQWSCGGALISERHVLTAAHCIYNFENMLYVVRLGELDYAREDDGAHPIDVLIKRKIVHKDYNANFKSNDIGLIILQKDVEFTEAIKPICIPKGKWRNETFEGYRAFIAGWGRTSFGGKPASHLQNLEVPIRGYDTCVKAFRPYKGRVIDQRVMCAGFKEGGRDSCEGDSGAPLMQNINWNGEYHFILVGVVSYSFL